jgi:hypothetical protein
MKAASSYLIPQTTRSKTLLNNIGLPLHQWQTRRVWTPLGRVSRRRRRCFLFPAPVVSHAAHQEKSILRVWFPSERTELTTHRRRIYRVAAGVPPPARMERRKSRQRKATRTTGGRKAVERPRRQPAAIGSMLFHSSLPNNSTVRGVALANPSRSVRTPRKSGCQCDTSPAARLDTT